MSSLIITFLSGFVVSLLGTIVPSGMSGTAMEISIKNGKTAGLLFGLGSAIVEIIYIRLYFLGFDFFIREKRLFIILQWIMLLLFFGAGVYFFIQSFNKKKTPKKKRKHEAKNRIHAFVLGVTIKAMSPGQFAFWIFWTTYLLANNWLHRDPMQYNVFCVGLGLATFVGTGLYVYLGEYLEKKSFFSRGKLDRFVGIAICATSVLWAVKLLW